MKVLKNKAIYIAPYTPISNALKIYLTEFYNIDFLGFIDKNKNAENIYKIQTIEQKYDFIVIFSPNHFQNIYDEYIKNGIKSSKIIVLEIINQQYKIKQNIQLKEDEIKTFSLKSPKKQGIVFISKGFIDANNKYLYLYCYKNNLNPTMITDNLAQIKELQEKGFSILKLDTKEANQKIAGAKYLIFDQANYTNFYIHENQITIQMWHGVGLKKMSKLTNIVYDYFISTSKWTNETNFKNIFLSKKYLDYGYPRNEFLLRDTQKSDLLLCDKKLYNISLKNKIVLYMPTIREYLFSKAETLESIINLNLLNLNNSVKKLGYMMIIKLHPHLIEFFKDFIIESDFSNILFHPPQGDIYPILKNTDILISDYSSIVYDFLLLDKPIIFFDYDRQEYENNMDGFLFEYDNYSPGIKVQTQEALIKALTANDQYKEKRTKIKKLFFEDSYQESCKDIMEIMNR